MDTIGSIFIVDQMGKVNSLQKYLETYHLRYGYAIVHLSYQEVQLFHKPSLISKRFSFHALAFIKSSAASVLVTKSDRQREQRRKRRRRMEMLRRTIRTAFRSFRMLRRRPEENEGSRRVHLQLNMMFYWEFTSEDMREFSYIGEETSSFYVNLSSLGTVEETAIQILQHLSNSEFEPLLLLIDDITLALSEMIHRVLAGRPSDLQAGVPPVISLSMRVTYHVEGWQDLAMNVEDQSTLRPASKASIDALERRKVEQEEESGENMCVVCQDEVGRSGDCIAMLSCSHEFHEDCILAWLERAYSCPVCRFELPTD